jgi:hypothetical protein
MRINTTKKVVAAVTVALFALLGTAAPAEAGGRDSQRTIWCC